MYSYNFTINRKKLETENNIILYENSMNVDELIFEFDESWNIYNEKIIIFMLGKKTLKRALINNKCIIPKEVYSYPMVQIGIIGKILKDNEIIEILPTNKLTLFIRDSVNEDNIDVEYPTEWDDYVLQITNVIKELREENTKIVEELELKADKEYVDNLIGNYEEEMKNLLEGAGI